MTKEAKELIASYKKIRMDILTTMDSVPCVISDFPTEKTCRILCINDLNNTINALEKVRFTPGTGASNINYVIDKYQQLLNEIQNVGD